MTVCFVPKLCKKSTSLVTYSCQVLITAEYSCYNKYEERGRDEEREREGKRERGEGNREGYIYHIIAPVVERSGAT